VATVEAGGGAPAPAMADSVKTGQDGHGLNLEPVGPGRPMVVLYLQRRIHCCR
jgi:hypothetical protein